MKNSKELTIPARRDMLLMTAKGAAGLLTAAALGSVSGPALAAFTLAPTMDEGPFCLDSVANKLWRSDIRASSGTGTLVSGFPLVLFITVSRITRNGSILPLSGAYVDIWQCDANGNYSGVTNFGAADLRDEDYLRGYQISSRRGVVRFKTIYPGWYPGRTTHIHVRIRRYSGTTAIYDQATQLFFDESLTDQIYAGAEQYVARGLKDTANVDDGIYLGSSGRPDIDGIVSDAGQYMLLKFSNDGSSVTASINLVIATSAGVAGLSCPTG